MHIFFILSPVSKWNLAPTHRSGIAQGVRNDLALATEKATVAPTGPLNT